MINHKPLSFQKRGYRSDREKFTCPRKGLDLISFISKNTISELSESLKEELEATNFVFEKVSLDVLSNKFQKLHQEIWQSEKKGPSAAFQELIKIFFVKIR